MDNRPLPIAILLILVVVGLFAILFNYNQAFQLFVVTLGKALLVLALSLILFITSALVGPLKYWLIGAGVISFVIFVVLGLAAFSIVDSAIAGI